MTVSYVHYGWKDLYKKARGIANGAWGVQDSGYHALRGVIISCTHTHRHLEQLHIALSNQLFVFASAHAKNVVGCSEQHTTILSARDPGVMWWWCDHVIAVTSMSGTSKGLMSNIMALIVRETSYTSERALRLFNLGWCSIPDIVDLAFFIKWNFTCFIYDT